ncbi:hypothetical protein I7I50_04673 [Histoplasma capsulatum G186AR]|uniref:Uncharacterized protein n=1 Tax=Ajellomyces capsulatus TaxID=5037 RepID=A0A8H8CXW1_AJECA|nr:hypothetical protein I7I52_05582 [Histoplasma capsulatum]QSS75518.1 hypothetical protein I7I50_04673 [Histoplasma capsulatum G186AR]
MKLRTIPSTSSTRDEATFQAPLALVEREPYNYIVRGPKHSNKSTQVAETNLHSPSRRGIHMAWDTIRPNGARSRSGRTQSYQGLLFIFTGSCFHCEPRLSR